MLLSTAQGLIVGPLLGEEERKINDLIALGGFGVGLTLALLPKEKKYHLEMPKKKTVKRLWRVKRSG